MNIQHITQNLNSCRKLYCNATVQNTAKKSASKGLDKFYNSEGLKKFLTSKGFGKLLDLSEKNPVILNSVYSLFLCTLLRPASIMALPGKNVDDKKYASAHSIASGVVGLVITSAILLPVGQRVRLVFGKPHKFLKPETVKRMFPQVATRTVEKDGKMVEEIVTKNDKMLQNADYETLRQREVKWLEDNHIIEKLPEMQQESLRQKEPYLCMSNEPIIYNGEPLRSQFLKKANGEGYALQSNGTPVLDELKRAEKENGNAEKILKMVPDLLVAAPRAAITVATIPFILSKVFGLQKPAKGQKAEEAKEISFNSNQPALQSYDYTALFPGLKKGVQ